MLHVARQSAVHVRIRAGALLIAALTLTLADNASAQNSRYTIDDILDGPAASLGELSADGRYVVVTTRTLRDRIGIDNHRFGDPTYVAPSVAEIEVVDTRTGARQRVLPGKRQAGAFAWSPDATRLAFILREGDQFRPVVWDRASGRIRNVALPRGQMIAADRDLEWLDANTLVLAVRPESWFTQAKQRFEHEVAGTVVVRSSKDPFLSWEEIRRLPLQQTIVAVDVTSGRTRELIPNAMLRSVDVVANGTALRYAEDLTKKTDYDVIFGSESNVVVRAVDGGEPRVVLPTTKGLSLQWSGDGRTYAYARNGRVFVGTIDGAEAKAILGDSARADGAGNDSARADDARNAVAPGDSARATNAAQRFSPMRLSHDGRWLIASNREGWYLVDTQNGAREQFHVLPDSADLEAPRWNITAWSNDGRYIYATTAARTKWERGVQRYDRETKQWRELVRDGRRYSGLRLSDDGSTIVFGMADGNQPTDYYAADADFSNIRRLTNTAAAFTGKPLGRSELIHYLDVDGRKQYGVVTYPVDYRPGAKYPTIFIVYETFFDDSFNSTINLLTTNGYVVVQPSVGLEQGYPGEAWLKGVTAAANMLIEKGIADPDRLGVHGTSYGGYATNLLITQTNRFKAAINISGKVDMISFYTDSPRLGVRNTHAPEKSQDRIGGTLWEEPMKYINHSAVMFADRIRTPLLIMTGAQDHNVPERTSSEMFYALRRLGREVEWVSYTNGGHGMPTSTVEEVVDYHTRIVAWYDKYLKAPVRDVKASQDQ